MMGRKAKKIRVATEGAADDCVKQDPLVAQYGPLAAANLLNIFYEEDVGELNYEILVGGYENIRVGYKPETNELRVRAEPILRRLASTVLATFGRDPLDVTLQIGYDARPIAASFSDGVLTIKIDARWRNAPADDQGFFELDVYNNAW